MTALESHAHRLAKGLLVGWFREAARAGDGWRCCGMSARPNRGAPYFGVFEEYPICDWQREGYPVWDEEDWHEDRWEEIGGRPPTRDELIRAGKPPKAILDIAVQHKGIINFGIEIKHKHAVPDAKAKFLDACEFPVFEVKANWLLSQVGIPSRLVVDRVFGKLNGSYTYDLWSDAA